MSTTAVVVTYNRSALVASCLDALAAQSTPVAGIVVVDNASSDGTPEYLRERGYLDRPGVRLETLESNRGGAGGFSHGVRIARAEPGDWIWLLDDDAEPAPGALRALLESPPAADPATACLAPVVRDAAGEVQRYHRGRWHKRPRPLAPAA